MDFGPLRLALPLSIVATAMLGCSQKVDTPAADKPIAAVTDLVKEHEAKDTGIDAYIYAYPLVTMEMTRRVMTDTATPEGSKAPMGQMGQTTRLSGGG